MTLIEAILMAFLAGLTLFALGMMVWLIIDQIRFSHKQHKKKKEQSDREFDAIRQQLAQSRASLNAIKEEFSPQLDKLPKTWTNEYVESWKVIALKVTEDDGMHLGFPHPDGPNNTAEPLKQEHAIGPTHQAVCKPDEFSRNYGTHSPIICETSPGLHCEAVIGKGCGWYGYKGYQDALDHIIDIYRYNPNTKTVYGVAKVKFSGTVIEYENGYRAQYMDVISLDYAIRTEKHDSIYSPRDLKREDISVASPRDNWIWNPA